MLVAILIVKMIFLVIAIVYTISTFVQTITLSAKALSHWVKNEDFKLLIEADAMWVPAILWTVFYALTTIK